MSRCAASLEPAGGLYIAESTKVIARALAAGHRPRSVLVQEQWLADVEPLLAEDPRRPGVRRRAAVLERLTGYHLHRGALAAMHRPALPAVGRRARRARRVVVLEDIVDHTNVGAIFRVGRRPRARRRARHARAAPIRSTGGASG